MLPPPDGSGSVEIDGDDFAFGFNLATMFEIGSKTRLGIIYWSKFDLDFSGDVKIKPGQGTISANVNTKVPLVQWARVGFYHEVNKKFALLATVGWEDWSELDSVNISVNAGSADVPRNWKDTWKFAGGIHYRPTNKWLLQCGIAYDTSAVEKDDRTPDMPVDRQIRYATGAQYDLRENLNLGGSVELVDFGSAEINNSLLIGDYKSNYGLFFALNLNWKF